MGRGRARPSGDPTKRRWGNMGEFKWCAWNGSWSRRGVDKCIDGRVGLFEGNKRRGRRGNETRRPYELPGRRWSLRFEEFGWKDGGWNAGKAGDDGGPIGFRLLGEKRKIKVHVKKR